VGTARLMLDQRSRRLMGEEPWERDFSAPRRDGRAARFLSQPHNPFHRHACETNRLLLFHTATAYARVARMLFAQQYQPTILQSAVISAAAVTTTPKHFLSLRLTCQYALRYAT